MVPSACFLLLLLLVLQLPHQPHAFTTATWFQSTWRKAPSPAPSLPNHVVPARHSRQPLRVPTMVDMTGGNGFSDQTEERSVPLRGVRTTLNEVDPSGRFVRTPSLYRSWIDDTKFRAQANRYHLYCSFACPWSTRVLSVLYMKGLDSIISVSVPHPTWQRTRPGDPMDRHTGWIFRQSDDPPLRALTGYGEFACDSCIPDFITGARTVRELYENSRDRNGKYTVPILWDKRLNTIVNNDSGDIMRILNSCFNDYADNRDLDLYPPSLAERIDDTNYWVHEVINEGVYKCGLARSQAGHDEAEKQLWEGIELAEQILSRQRFLCGDVVTESDIRLFQTLVRLDEVYAPLFKCHRQRIVNYPHLLNYCREIYQLPGVSLSVNMQHIKVHYFSSHPSLNPFSIVPRDVGFYRELYRPHDRESIGVKTDLWL